MVYGYDSSANLIGYTSPAAFKESVTQPLTEPTPKQLNDDRSESSKKSLEVGEIQMTRNKSNSKVDSLNTLTPFFGFNKQNDNF